MKIAIDWMLIIAVATPTFIAGLWIGVKLDILQRKDRFMHMFASHSWATAMPAPHVAREESPVKEPCLHLKCCGGTCSDMEKLTRLEPPDHWQLCPPCAVGERRTAIGES